MTRAPSIFRMFIFRIMVWNNEKDKLFCREVLIREPYQYKARSKERGNVWKQIADCLNFKKSGISPEDTPLDETINSRRHEIESNGKFGKE